MTGLRCFSLYPGCGYGDAAVEVIDHLDQRGVAVRWSPCGADPYQPSGSGPLRLCRPRAAKTLGRLLSSTTHYDAVLIALPPVDIYASILDREAGARRYAYCTWELERVPQRWKEQIERLDGVLVPSHFNAKAFRDSGFDVPVWVAPHLPRVHDPARDADWRALCADRLVFYTIATWSERKNMEETIRAYLDAFSASDPVLFLIKTPRVSLLAQHRMGNRRDLSVSDKTILSSFQLARILADYPDPAPIHLVAKTLSGRQLDEIHEVGDCFVSLSHSEGWGLGAYDALQAGNAVVMPGFGGQMDYLGSDYPLLVEYQLEPCRGYEFCSQYGQEVPTQWAKPDRAHASALLGSLARRPSRLREVGEAWQQRIARSFRPERIAGEMARFMGIDS